MVAFTPAPAEAKYELVPGDALVGMFAFANVLGATGALVSTGFAARDLNRGFRTNNGVGIAANIFGWYSILIGSLTTGLTARQVGNDRTGTAFFGAGIAVLAIGVTTATLGIVDLMLPRDQPLPSITITPVFRRDATLIAIAGTF